MEPEKDYRKRDIGIATAFAALTFLILWLRRPDALLHPQLWAEDGAIFFKEQMLSGFAQALMHPYSGYIHVIPRLIAGFMDLWPVRWTPLGYNLLTLLLEAVAFSAFFWPCFRRIIRSDALRAASCLVMTTGFMAGFELVGTVSNVQWYLSPLSLFLLAATENDTTKTEEAALTAGQVLIALTAPATLLLAPILLWQVKTKPGWLKVRPTLHLAALCLQLWIMSRAAAPGLKPILHFNSLLLATLSSGLSRCVLAPMIGGGYLTQDLPLALFTKLVIALIACVAAGTWLVLRRDRFKGIGWLLAALYFGLGSLGMVMSGRGFAKDFTTLDGIQHFTAQRYFLIGACMFIVIVALALNSVVPETKAFVSAGVMLVVFALGIVRNYPATRFVECNWNANVVNIQKWHTARKRHEKAGTVSFPINPDGWTVSLEDK